MYYTYVLLSQKDKKFYIGYSEDVGKRFLEHQAGEVVSTKPRRPLDLLYYEAHRNRYDALRRERYFKTDKGKTTLRMMLREDLLSIGITI